MEKLEYDPYTKSKIKDALYSFLYEPVQKQFRTRLETLVIRNTVMGGYGHKHFSYKGVTYNCDVTAPPLRKNRLVPALRATMDEYLEEVEQLNNHELPYVLGFINQVLNSSPDLTDYLRIFPESVHHPLTKMMATCPCRNTSLPDERVLHLQSKNQAPIDMMRQRLVMNLLL